MQFVRKTSSRGKIIRLILKLTLVFIAVLGIIFLLNKIEFPAPTKQIEKTISNENFKIIK